MSNIARPNQFQRKHSDAFETEAQLRWFLFSKRAELEAAGAIFKNGRRLFIVEDKFFEVMTRGTSAATRSRVA